MEDFNIPNTERVALLERLQDALERLVQCGHEYPEILRAFSQQTYTMAHYWGPSPHRAQSQPSTPKKSTPSNLDSSPSTPPIKRQKTSDSPALLCRNQQFRDLAEQRDKFCCVLTGDVSIEVAHIYPHHSIKHKEEDIFGQRHIFWDHLKNFWSKEKVATWEAELFPTGICEFGVERVCNLITLSRNAHDMWGRGAFALKPISESDDKMALEVQFFWQDKQKDTQQTMSLLTRPSSTEGFDQNVGAFGGAARLFRNDKRIKSGDYFKLQTDDPEIKPLPSFQLLELQWFLQRIQDIAGAADVDWSPYSDSGSACSDEEEIPDLTLDDEFRESSLVSIEPLPSPTKFVHST